ncbi:class A beta-lactamase-related serine hydrolase [Fulvivirga sp. RKSG066]|uniref:serine hydrolase domain-containing protein n=1 Tax=Fulvivirga aurantia TaxID=2529383 RepID=UPI0012BBB106|nr:serine hydrolase domain-containing protein [Fulvivirga aurantia]MTI21566.1 class A beta-lactamase-related serine hydrolase [Fulvivirga aurantia]
MRKNLLIILSLTLLLTVGAWFGYYKISENRVADLEVHPLPQPEIIGGDDVRFERNDSSFLCEMENHVLYLKDRYNIPGTAIVIVKEGEIIYKKGFGFANVKTHSPVTTSTIFRIGSVSKGFASSLAGLLEQDGFIDWKAPITRYLPDYHVNPIEFADSITVEHILSHTSGYPYQAYSTLIEDGMPLGQMLEELQALRLSRNPGAIHSYQNVAYSLIEQVLQSQTYCSFNTLMHERIFKPLGMHTASIDYKSISEAENVALPHYYSRLGTHVGKIRPTYYNASAAGGINASIDDMGKWLQAVMGHRPDVLSHNLLADLHEPHVVTSVKNSYLGRLERPRRGHYGLGWRIVEYPSDTIVYHGGYVNGYKSAIGFSKADDVGICILSNRGGRYTSQLLADFFKIYRNRE